MCSPESRVFTQGLDCGRTTKRVTNHSSCCYIHSALESMHKIMHLQQTFPISTPFSTLTHLRKKKVRCQAFRTVNKLGCFLENGTYLKLLEVKVALHHVANLSTIIQELK